MTTDLIFGIKNNEIQKSKTIYYVEVRDHSGSMKKIRKEVIDGSNNQLRTLLAEKKGMNITATVVNFGSKVHPPILINAPIEKICLLSDETFNPLREWTALYDAIGSTIDLVKQFPAIDEENTFVYFVIISDGAENSSTAYTALQIANTINELKATSRWTFVYIGANHDLDMISKGLGIEKGNMLKFISSSNGAKKAYNANSKALINYLKDRKNNKNSSKKIFGFLPKTKDGIGITSSKLIEGNSDD